MVPDLNRDGKRDRREYMDDLGGAYYFRPPGLDKPINIPFWLRRNGKLIDALFWIALGLTILFLF